MQNNFFLKYAHLDAGTLNFGDSSTITVNTPNDLRKAAKRLKEIGVKPEIEAFDLGNMWFGAQLYKEGLLSDPPMFQMCLGIPWGAPANYFSNASHVRYNASKKVYGLDLQFREMKCLLLLKLY